MPLPGDWRKVEAPLRTEHEHTTRRWFRGSIREIPCRAAAIRSSTRLSLRMDRVPGSVPPEARHLGGRARAAHEEPAPVSASSPVRKLWVVTEKRRNNNLLSQLKVVYLLETGQLFIFREMTSEMKPPASYWQMVDHRDDGRCCVCSSISCAKLRGLKSQSGSRSRYFQHELGIFSP